MTGRCCGIAFSPIPHFSQERFDDGETLARPYRREVATLTRTLDCPVLMLVPRRSVLAGVTETGGARIWSARPER